MNKKIVLIVVITVAIIFCLILLGVKGYNKKKNQDEIDSAIHGVVISDNVPFYKKAETENVKQIKLLEKGENVYILDEFE